MKNLLIVGAGQYGKIIEEYVRALNEYDKIDFLDDENEAAIGKVADCTKFVDTYEYALVAIGNGTIRLGISDKLKATGFKIASFISDRSFVSPSAVIEEGCVIEPMAVVAAGSKICRCTIISSGAVVNHNSTVLEGSHINCNSTVRPNCTVPAKTKLECGKVF